MNKCDTGKRFADTDSGIGAAVADPGTTPPIEGDWVFPETQVQTVETGANDWNEVAAPTTEFTQSRIYTAPLRKSSLGVKLSKQRNKVLQQWEGTVLSRQEEVVCCELYDLTDESNPVEYAELYISEFSEYDRPLLSEGAVFYWSIGHITRPNGQVWRSSEIRVRRMPRLTGSQRTEISRKVENFGGLIVNH